MTATGSTGTVAHTTFTDASSLSLSPATGSAGTSVAVTSGGGGFTGLANNIGIYWDGTLNSTSGTLLTTCSVNNGGNIVGTCSFIVPSRDRWIAPSGGDGEDKHWQ